MKERLKWRPLFNGWQGRTTFENGYGVSVVQHSGSYGGDEGLWELAVIGPDGKLTDGGGGFLTLYDVEHLMREVSELPSAS